MSPEYTVDEATAAFERGEIPYSAVLSIIEQSNTKMGDTTDGGDSAGETESDTTDGGGVIPTGTGGDGQQEPPVAGGNPGGMPNPIETPGPTVPADGTGGGGIGRTGALAVGALVIVAVTMRD